MSAPALANDAAPASAGDPLSARTAELVDALADLLVRDLLEFPDVDSVNPSASAVP